MSRLVLDPSKSSLRVETRAKGLLAKLAHDLSIEGPAPNGTCELDGGRFVLALELPVASLRIAGVRKGGRVDTSVLSKGDLDEIHRKLREEVLVGSPAIVVRAEGKDPGEAASVAADLVVRAGRGEQKVRADVTLRRDGDRVVVEGKVMVSLEALRIPPVKAPLGAFRVDDAIEVYAHLELAPGE